MSKYLEFHTPRTDGEIYYAVGMPFLYGDVPKTESPVVRLDEVPLLFDNVNIPKLLQRAAQTMKGTVSASVNCRRFAALLHNSELSETLPKYFLRPDYSSPVKPSDPTVTTPVILGTFGDASSLEEDDFYGRHMAFPAHLPNQPSYLHKLGYGGPICLSGLQKAMDVYKCTHAFQPIGFATGELK